LVHPVADGQVDVNPGGELADQPRPQHELVGERLSVGGILAKRRNERLREPHLVGVFRLVRALDAGLVAQPLDRLATQDVRLGDQALAPAASFAAFRSNKYLSTSSRIAVTMSFSGTLRMTSPFLKISPIPRPPATPMSAARASPGPLTSHPITAMWISSLRAL